MSSQAPEKAARFSAKHQLETWSRKQGSTSPSTIMQIPTTSTGSSFGSGVAVARVYGSEVNTNGSVTTLSGVTLQPGDVVFLPGQLSPADNGLWVVQPDGAPWVRQAGTPSDWAIVLVNEGNILNSSVWRLMMPIDSIVGTDELYWDMLTDATEFINHTIKLANATDVGHVILDDVTIKKNGSNKIYTVLSGSGSTNYATVWTGTASIGYASDVQFGVSTGAIRVSTNARVGVSINQSGNFKGLEVVRSGAGAATSPVTTIDAQDATDGTVALEVRKAGTNAAAVHFHSDHGVSHVNITEGSGTSTIVTVSEDKADSTGTPAAGFGVRHRMNLKSSDTVDRQAASTSVEWIVATDSTRTARWRLWVSDYSAEREAMRVDTTGSALKIGFFGVAAVTKPAAPTAENTSTVDATYGTQERDVINNLRTRLGEVITALKNLGLMS